MYLRCDLTIFSALSVLELIYVLNILSELGIQFQLDDFMHGEGLSATLGDCVSSYVYFYRFVRQLYLFYQRKKQVERFSSFG